MTGRLARWIVVSAVVCSTALGASAAVPAPAGAVAAPALAGVNVFTGSRNATMLLRLTRPAYATIFGDGMNLAGAGRFSGFLLERVARVPYFYPTGGAVVYDFSAGACSTPGCPGPFNYRPDAAGVGLEAVNVPEPSQHAVTGQERMTTDSGTLPAGLYRLYFVADHTPVRATLRLAGLSGAATFHPSAPVAMTYQLPPPSQALPSTADPALYSAGDTHTLTRPAIGTAGGYVLTILWKREPLPDEVNFIGGCEGPGTPPPARSGPLGVYAAYQYPCGSLMNVTGVPSPWGSLQTTQRTVLVPGTPAQPVYLAVVNALYTFPPGRWNFGEYDDSTGPALDAHYLMLWIQRQ